MVSGSETLPQVKVDRSLVKRLLEASSQKSGSIYGCLYGLPSPPPASSSTDDDDDARSPYYVWTATGRSLSATQEAEAEAGGGKEVPEKRKLDVLTEILPCGIDPLGVFAFDSNQEDEDDVDLGLVQELVEQLPEAFLDVTDPLVFTLAGVASRELRAFIFKEGSLLLAEVVEVDAAEIEKQCQVIRVRGDVTLVSLQTTADLEIAFKNLIEKVSCPYGTFRLENSDVFFLHVWQTKKSSSSGWASQEIVDEDEEQCLVTNIDDSARKITDLWRFIKDEVEDDGFGTPKDKKKVEEKESLNFRLLMKMSGEACSTKTLNCAPILHFEKREAKHVRLPIKIDAIGIVRKGTNIPDVMEVLKGCIQRQIHEMGRSVLSELKMRGTVSLPEAFHYKPEPLGHLCSVVYNRGGTCSTFSEFRKHIHGLFMLPIDRPLFRRLNCYRFEDDLPKKGPLTNVHVGLKMGSSGGEIELVRGAYSYHHYMQDNFDDDGWGCAYRSLQTLISWFRHQGYTATEIPTHSQIQKCLVDIGDKEASFIGSRKWIGSTEVGFVLEKCCDVQSKFLSVSSGEEMVSRGRDLAHHFQTNGTPVMIGGGVLAHTILGVDWNETTGDTRWLILDPHYTGSDWTSSGGPNLGFIQQKGWVGWKGPNFWVKDAFYNMCLPQKPKQW